MHISCLDHMLTYLIRHDLLFIQKIYIYFLKPRRILEIFQFLLDILGCTTDDDSTKSPPPFHTMRPLRIPHQKTTKTKITQRSITWRNSNASAVHTWVMITTMMRRRSIKIPTSIRKRRRQFTFILSMIIGLIPIEYHPSTASLLTTTTIQLFIDSSSSFCVDLQRFHAIHDNVEQYQSSSARPDPFLLATESTSITAVQNHIILQKGEGWFNNVPCK